MEKDDYLIVSFGHNDEKINDLSRYTDPFGEYQDNLLYFAKENNMSGFCFYFNSWQRCGNIFF